MLIAFIFSNVAWVCLLGYLIQTHRKVLALTDARESARDQNHREHVRHLEDQIVLLKVDPVQAATYAAPQAEDDLVSLIGDDSPAADEAWAEMVERNRS